MPDWRFKKMTRADMNSDPVEAEFFTSEGFVDGLVRETIQNSLDARLKTSRKKNTPAKVRFDFTGITKPLPWLSNNTWFEKLFLHLDAQNDDNIPELYGNPFPFIVIEDFETRGLEGDIQQHEDIEANGERSDFYYFWRNVGRSGKSSHDMGRWGVGKTVFPASSRINSFFGFTLREHDKKTYLMGQSVLKIHSHSNDKFSPYGYFANFEGDEGFQLPISDKDLHKQFRKDFHLSRISEPGLSIVIPFPAEDLTPAALTKSVILDFFYPILDGSLLVEVVDGSQVTVLSKSTLSTIVTQIDWAGSNHSAVLLNSLIRFASWAISLDDKDHYTLQRAGINRAPSWNEDLFPESDLIQFRDKFEDRQRLGFHVPLTVENPKGNKSDTLFSVYLQKDTEITVPELSFIREGLTISKITTGKRVGVRGLVVIRDRVLSAILGDSENPAHTNWEPNSKRLSKNYRRGASRVRFVKSAFQELTKLLSPPEGVRDEFTLMNYFPITNDDPGTQDTNKTRKPKIPTGIKRKPSIATISSVNGGCSITAGENTPGALKVEFAFDRIKGNPFSHYRQFDFDLSDKIFQIDQTGVSILTRNKNTIVFSVTDPDFNVTVKGFDPSRDIQIRVNPADTQ